MSKKAPKSRLLKINVSNLSNFPRQHFANDEWLIHDDSSITMSYLLSRKHMDK